MDRQIAPHTRSVPVPATSAFLGDGEWTNLHATLPGTGHVAEVARPGRQVPGTQHACAARGVRPRLTLLPAP